MPTYCLRGEHPSSSSEMIQPQTDRESRVKAGKRRNKIILVGRHTPGALPFPSKTRIFVSPVNRMLTSILCFVFVTPVMMPDMPGYYVWRNNYIAMLMGAQTDWWPWGSWQRLHMCRWAVGAGLDFRLRQFFRWSNLLKRRTSYLILRLSWTASKQTLAWRAFAPFPHG